MNISRGITKEIAMAMEIAREIVSFLVFDAIIHRKEKSLLLTIFFSTATATIQ